ncbi:hypothetical protein [Pseudarthrobacter sp. S9]|uniref:hypothetical protein n=1 Tax=Pseudarthrobacter sp. S9 TaxID=3418421 RepID=UPI003D055BAF
MAPTAASADIGAIAIPVPGTVSGLVAALPSAAIATSIADDAGLRTDPFMLGMASGEP